MKTRKRISHSETGYTGTPGSSYEIYTAKIYTIPSGYEIVVEHDSGSNQGQLESAGETEDRWRAETLESLHDLAISGLEEKLDHAEMRRAIRDAIYDAQDEENDEDD